MFPLYPHSGIHAIHYLCHLEGVLSLANLFPLPIRLAGVSLDFYHILSFATGSPSMILFSFIIITYYVAQVNR